MILIFTHTPGEDQLGPMWRHISYGFGNGCQLKQLKKTANGGVLGRHAAPRLTKPRSPDSNFFGTPLLRCNLVCAIRILASFVISIIAVSRSYGYFFFLLPIARQQILKVLDNVSATKFKHDRRHTSTYSHHSYCFPTLSYNYS